MTRYGRFFFSVSLVAGTVVASSRSANAQMASGLRMAEYNIDTLIAAQGSQYQGCSTDFFGSPDFTCRLYTITTGVRAANYDFVVFTEAFSDEAKYTLVSALSDMYPYYIFSLSKGYARVGTDSGLMLFSKWPMDLPYAGKNTDACSDGTSRKGGHNPGAGLQIGWTNARAAFRVFGDAETKYPDSLADKGVGYVRLLDPHGFHWNIFLTQLVAFYGSDDYCTGTNCTTHFDAKTQIQRREFGVIKQLADCIIDPRQYDSEMFVVTGDLNLNGDLSNPWIPFSTETSLSWQLRHDRRQWDNLLNQYSTDTQYPDVQHWFTTRVLDSWAYSMTPPRCWPTPDVAPISPDCSAIGPNAPYLGSALFDRGLTNASWNDEERLDHILFGAPFNSPMCVQHVTQAWNLWAGKLSGGSSFEGGITPPPGTPLGTLNGGSDPTSDHIGINAEIHPIVTSSPNPYCNPSKADADPPPEPTPGTFTITDPGAVQWFAINTPGTYTFNVSQKNWDSHGPDNGLVYRVYDPRESEGGLSRPILPYKGESQYVPGLSDKPGFTDKKFSVSQAPFYVKVYDPNASYSGNYFFRYRRNNCQDLSQTCAIRPYEHDDNTADTTPPRRMVWWDSSAGPSQYYEFHVDRADTSAKQTLTFYATEKDTGGADNLASVELLRVNSDGSMTSVAIQTTKASPPQINAGSGEPVKRWTIVSTDGSLEGNSVKYILKVNRRTDIPPVGFWYWPGWKTDLTWMYGNSQNGTQLFLECEDTATWGSDSPHLDIQIDNYRWNLPCSSPGWSCGGNILNGFSMGEMDEGDSRDWAGLIFSPSAINAWGESYGTNKSLKFVTQLDVGLHIGDSIDIDSQTLTVPGLGTSPGPRINWNDNGHLGWDFNSGVYKITINLDHSRPGRACTSNSDCAAPGTCGTVTGMCGYGD